MPAARSRIAAGQRRGPESTSGAGHVAAELLRHLLTATAPEAVAAFGVSAARAATGAEVSWCGLLHDTDLTMAAHSGLRTVRMAAEWSLPLGVGVGGRVAAEGRALSVRDYRHDPRRAPDKKTMIDEEGIRAAMCAPVTAGGQILGVLYAARRETYDWSSAELSTLTEFAADCGVAIARLNRGLGPGRRDNGFAGAEAILDLQRDLAEVLGATDDLSAGALLLQRRFGLAVDLVDPNGNSLLGPAGDHGPIRFRCALPDRSGEQLLVAGDRELSADERNAVRAAAITFGLQLRVVRATAAAVRRAGRDLVEALIARSKDLGSLRSEAALLGVDLQAPHHVVCLGAHRDGQNADPTPLSGAAVEQLERAVATTFPGSLMVTRNGDAVLVLPAPAGARTQDRLRALIRERTLPGAGLAAGLGRRCTSPRDFPEAYGEASLGLDLARRQPAAGEVFTRSELGLTGLLAAGGSSRKTLEGMVDAVLGPLLQADAQEGTDYVRTLRGWLAQDRHLERSAAVLHVHPNTVRYRVARAQQILGLDLKSVDNRFQIDLALRVLEALEGTGAAGA